MLIVLYILRIQFCVTYPPEDQLKVSSLDIWMPRCRLLCHNQGIYLDEYIRCDVSRDFSGIPLVSKITHSSVTSFNTSFNASFNTSILLCRSMDWFLYDRDLCHERVLHPSSESLFLNNLKCKYCNLSGFSFTNIHDSQDSKGRGKLSLYILSTTSTCFTDTY